MSINKALENLKYDVRLVDYHLNNGIISKADVEKHLKDLPDLSHQVAQLDEDLSSDDDDQDSSAPTH